LATTVARPRIQYYTGKQSSDSAVRLEVNKQTISGLQVKCIHQNAVQNRHRNKVTQSFKNKTKFTYLGKTVTDQNYYIEEAMSKPSLHI
jgi:hypothetical protein